MQLCNGQQECEGIARCCPGLGTLLTPEFFKALCDPNRIRILCRLGEIGEPCTVSRIAECCPVDLSVVSRHLAILRQGGILRAERRGKEVYYSIRVGDVARIFRAIADALEACCPDEEAKHGSER